MAKKKKIVDLKPLKISYKENNLTYKLNFLKTTNMTVEMASYKDDTFIENKTIPFAHLPKAIKLLVKPV